MCSLRVASTLTDPRGKRSILLVCRGNVDDAGPVGAGGLDEGPPDILDGDAGDGGAESRAAESLSRPR